MAQNDTEICRRFVAGEELKKSLLSRTKDNGFHRHLVRDVGVARLSFCQAYTNATELLSYERFLLAVRIQKDKQPFVILNADTPPSRTTNEHQREIRSAVKRTKMRFCFLPFSALRAAQIPPSEVEIVHTTEDREVKVMRKYRNRSTGEVKEEEVIVHYLGETLFRHAERLYVSGLDRNDDPDKRKFFLTRLPEGSKAKTVDQALIALRPKRLPKDALRQGEWFFVRADVRPEKDAILREHEAHSGEKKRGVPILFDDSEQMRDMVYTWEMRNRSGRHVATRVYLNGKVFVSGMVRDEEHNPLKLGDGREWFRVVKNLADGSWGATGDVD